MTNTKHLDIIIHPDHEERVNECIKRDLSGGDVIRIRQVESDSREGYWENAYIVAWHRSDDKAGTHRVCINSEGRSMAVWGHYFDGTGSAAAAINDFEKRTA